MAGLSVSGRNAALTDFAARALFVSGHTADPGDTGTSEISGGSPAAARKSVTWNAPANGTMTASNQPVLDVPGLGAGSLTHLGYWTALIGGTFLGSRPLDTPQPFPTQGTYTASGITESRSA